MAKLGTLLAVFVILASIALLGGVVFWLFTGFPSIFALLPPTEKVTLITGAITIVGSTTAVMIGRSLDKRRELESSLRQKKIPIYDSFLKKVLSIFQNPSMEDDDMVAFLQGWQSELLLWGSGDVVKAYAGWMATLKSEAGEPTARSVRATESLFRAIRKELGHEDRNLPEDSFLFVILRHPELFVKMSKANPNVRLAEIAAVEAAFEHASPKMRDGTDATEA